MNEGFLSERDIGRIQQQLEDLIRTNSSTDNTFSDIFNKLEGYSKCIVILEAKEKEIGRIIDEQRNYVARNSDNIAQEREARIESVNYESKKRTSFEEGVKGSVRATKWMVGIMTLICIAVTAFCAIITLAG